MHADKIPPYQKEHFPCSPLCHHDLLQFEPLNVMKDFAVEAERNLQYKSAAIMFLQSAMLSDGTCHC